MTEGEWPSGSGRSEPTVANEVVCHAKRELLRPVGTGAQSVVAVDDVPRDGVEAVLAGEAPRSSGEAVKFLVEPAVGEVISTSDTISKELEKLRPEHISNLDRQTNRAGRPTPSR